MLHPVAYKLYKVRLKIFSVTLCINYFHDVLNTIMDVSLLLLPGTFIGSDVLDESYKFFYRVSKYYLLFFNVYNNIKLQYQQIFFLLLIQKRYVFDSTCYQELCTRTPTSPPTHPKKIHGKKNYTGYNNR
jgi:hypothetical protein